MRIAIIGRTEILLKCAEHILSRGHTIPLIITSKEAIEYKVTSKDFELLANSIGAKYIYTPKINELEIINNIKNIGIIDIAVSINYSGILSKQVIDLFKLGVLNAHGGDLPRYRGNACQAWAIINKEDKIGLCIHKMKGGELDSGDIIEREFLSINLNTRIGQVYDWMELLTPKLMYSAINKLTNNNNYILESQSTNPHDALRCYPRTPEDGLINWNNNSDDIIRLINASSEPFSGAYSFVDGHEIKIWRAKLIDDQELYLGVPGQVTKIYRDTGYVEVLTFNGKIRIEDVSINSQRGVPTLFIKSLRQRFKSK
jgi:methionyl-tRNA formyltransferase